MNNFDLKTIVKDNMACFSHAIAGVLYYKIETAEGKKYQFPVDMNDRSDVGTATFNATHKAINLMRYVRKAIDNNELIVF